jgi:hypothetical protein
VDFLRRQSNLLNSMYLIKVGVALQRSVV